MRELSKLDRKIIDRIIDAYNKRDLQELQVARLLREELEVFALEWDYLPYNISIYAPRSNGKPDFARIKTNFFDICNFLYLIEELHKEGYIKLQTIWSDKKHDYPKQLFDRKKYEKKGQDYVEFTGNGILYFIPSDYSKYNLDIVDYLEKYAFKIVFPLHSLIEFKERGYITEEQNYKREEIQLSRKSVDSAKNATWAAALGTLFTALGTLFAIFTTIKSCNDENILNLNDRDIQRIESAIIKQKHISIDSICTTLPDTLNVKVTGSPEKQPINLNVTVKENQPTKIQ